MKLYKSIFSLILALSLILTCSLLFTGCQEALTQEELTPEQYLKMLEGKNLINLAASLGDLSDNVKIYQEPNSRMSMHLTFHDIVLDELESSMGEDVDLSFLSNLKLNIESDRTGEANKLQFVMSIQNQELLTVNVLAQLAQNVIYAGSPDLSDTYIKFDIEEMLGDLTGNDLTSLYSLLTALPDKETLTALISRYGDMLLSSIQTVERSTVVLEAEGISQTATQLTVKVHEQELVQLCKKLLKEAKADTQLRDVISNMSAALKNGDLYSEFLESIDEALAELDGRTEIDPEPMLISTYVDAGDNIIGRKITMEDPAKGGIYFYNVSSSNEIATVVSVQQESGEILKFSGKGAMNSDKLSGEYVLHYNDGQFGDFDYLKISLKDLTGESGTVNIKPTAEFLQALGVDMTLSFFTFQTTFDAYSYGLSIVNDGTMLMGLQLYFDNDAEGLDFDVPDKTVDAMDSEAMQEWASALDLDALIQKLRDLGAGSLIDMLKSQMDQASQPGYSTDGEM